MDPCKDTSVEMAVLESNFKKQLLKHPFFVCKSLHESSDALFQLKHNEERNIQSTLHSPTYTFCMVLSWRWHLLLSVPFPLPQFIYCTKVRMIKISFCPTLYIFIQVGLINKCMCPSPLSLQIPWMNIYEGFIYQYVRPPLFNIHII